MKTDESVPIVAEICIMCPERLPHHSYNARDGSEPFWHDSQSGLSKGTVSCWIEVKRSTQRGSSVFHKAVHNTFKEQDNRFCTGDKMDIDHAKVKRFTLAHGKESERDDRSCHMKGRIELMFDLTAQGIGTAFLFSDERYFNVGRSSIIVEPVMFPVNDEIG